MFGQLQERVQSGWSAVPSRGQPRECFRRKHGGNTASPFPETETGPWRCFLVSPTAVGQEVGSELERRQFYLVFVSNTTPSYCRRNPRTLRRHVSGRQRGKEMRPLRRDRREGRAQEVLAVQGGGVLRQGVSAAPRFPAQRPSLRVRVGCPPALIPLRTPRRCQRAAWREHKHSCREPSDLTPSHEAAAMGDAAMCWKCGIFSMTLKLCLRCEQAAYCGKE